MVEYTITTVDWNHKQTKRWLRFVNKNCPAATIALVPDTKPIPWNWASGKLNCFKKISKTDRLVYMDTDTLVFNDIEHAFDDMGDAIIGISNKLTADPQHKKQKIIAKTIILSEHFNFKYPVEHFSTGMILIKDSRRFATELYWGWSGVMQFPPFKNLFRLEIPAGEMAFSYWLAMTLDRDMIYNIPLEIHGVLEKTNTRFGRTDCSEVVHYHNMELLKKHVRSLRVNKNNRKLLDGIEFGEVA